MLTVNLSYIIATYNRLPFLRITIEKLISELQPDEEIVVVDGDSNDGTKDYLQQLFTAGKIHRFISESDKNQAHAWNKAMLLADGTILKKVIDDDVFCYEAIRMCKNYMLEHTGVDVVISNDLSSSLYNSITIEKRTRLPQFEKWRSGLVPSFTFSDVNMLVRRKALSFIGLYKTDFIMMDWEYALRISYLKANIVYYTGYNALTVGHDQSVTSLKNEQLIVEQGKKTGAYYEYAGDAADITTWSKIKIAIGKLIYKTPQGKLDTNFSPKDIGAIYHHYYKALADINGTETFTFIEGR
jgi:glycosyltransferase involved in cell wall biosynthesis